MRGERVALEEIHAVVYCLVPRDLASRLHDTLRDFYADDPTINVVVDQRRAERRHAERRRSNDARSKAEDRRKIQGRAGRRVSDRRAPVLPVGRPPLPRKAQRFADRLVFVERFEPPTRDAKDIEAKRLVVRYQGGDTAAMNELYLRYFAEVYGYARISLRDHHEAEDVTQQVFEGAIRSIDRYRADIASPFNAWLFTIARNKVSKAVRRRRSNRVEVAGSVELFETGSFSRERLESTIPRLRDNELSLFLQRLPLSQREVIVMRYVLDMSMKQIASVTGRSPDAVGKLHGRALETLKGRLGAVGRRPAHSRRNRTPMLMRIRPARVIISRRFSLGSRL